MMVRGVWILLVYVSFTMASPVDNSQTEPGKCSSDPFARSSNDFGFELTRQLGGNGNLFVSPLSIFTALAMTFLGAGTRTAEQMEAAFRLKENGLNGGDIHNSFQKLLKLYQNQNDQYSLSLANGLFLQQNFTVKQTYVEQLQSYYQAVVELVDFMRHSEETKKTINSWVAEKTNDKIPNFLTEPLSPTTRLALLNAVYFKGTWKTLFDKDSTKDGKFYTSFGAPQTAKLMSLRKVFFPYYEDYQSGYKFLELPYKGEDIAMLIALPKSAQEFPDLQMTSSLLCEITSKLRLTELEQVAIPKFHLEYKNDLKDALIGSGIQDLFTTVADLSGIRDEKDLFVSYVLHNAVIDVNEEGSEAAAVTGVIITKMSLFTDPEFIADHPFGFYIIDKRNGLVLFSGRFVQP